MDKKTETIETYNRSAKALADKFDSIRPRISCIEEAFSFVQKNNPKVLEIGCGNGRDALEIIKKTNNYLGIDISEELIKLAKEKVLGGNFEIADAVYYEFPRDLDIVIAFASLIHVNKQELELIIGRLNKSLAPAGIIYLSLKYADKYKEVTEEDEFGKRTYYLYSEKDIKEISPEFTMVKNEIENIRGRMWLEAILQKTG